MFSSLSPSSSVPPLSVLLSILTSPALVVWQTVWTSAGKGTCFWTLSLESLWVSSTVLKWLFLGEETLLLSVEEVRNIPRLGCWGVEGGRGVVASSGSEGRRGWTGTGELTRWYSPHFSTHAICTHCSCTVRDAAVQLLQKNDSGINNVH